MPIYAEWHWSCTECDEHSEEPWGDPEAALDDLDAHVREAHLQEAEAPRD
jgi:hypothetical protein